VSGLAFGVGAVSLFLAAAAMVAAAVWGELEVWLAGWPALPPGAVKAVFGIWAVTFVCAGAVFARIALNRLAVQRALRRQGPKGMIFITPETVREMAGLLLREELGLHRFRVSIRPMGEGLALDVSLRLPPGEEVPALAERLQSLLAHEVSAKTGLEIPEVRMIVEGTAKLSRIR